MMIGVPYNPIIGEMSVDGGDDGRAAAPGFSLSRGGAVRPDGQSAPDPTPRGKRICTRPDPAGEADKFLSFFAPSRTVTCAQSPTACSQHAIADSSGPDIDGARSRPRHPVRLSAVGVIFRHAVRPSFYTVPAPAIVLSDGRGHEAARTPSAVVHPG